MELIGLKSRLAEDMVILIKKQERRVYETRCLIDAWGERPEHTREVLAMEEATLSRMKTALKDFTGIDYDKYLENEMYFDDPSEDKGDCLPF